MRILQYDLPQQRREFLEVFTSDYFQTDHVAREVRDILAEVRAGGDAALLAFTHEFDGMMLTAADLAVPRSTWEQARALVSGEFLQALEVASRNITAFHERQREASWEFERDGVRLSQRIAPLAAVGLYVPGGRALYPSTVLMLAIPARLAEVPRIVMVTPPHARGVNAHLLVAALVAGVTEVYQVGGAQAIAALAFGTETIAKVDKIVGPGNLYVTAAKQQVFGAVDIDNLAGPSEIAVLADESANPEWVARDLIAQLEHDSAARAALVTTSAELAQRVAARVKTLARKVPRAGIVQEAVQHSCVAAIVSSVAQGVAAINAIAPEHLHLMLQSPDEVVQKITNAGCIFVGEYSPVPMGDYLAGTNHTLPTGLTARFGSPLGVTDFYKRTSVVEYSREAFLRESPHVETLAAVEELPNHAEAIRVRRQAGEGKPASPARPPREE